MAKPKDEVAVGDHVKFRSRDTSIEGDPEIGEASGQVLGVYEYTPGYVDVLLVWVPAGRTTSEPCVMEIKYHDILEVT
jgi:hypothetical protein